jgi:hypothetical protein
VASIARHLPAPIQNFQGLPQSPSRARLISTCHPPLQHSLRADSAASRGCKQPMRSRGRETARHRRWRAAKSMPHPAGPRLCGIMRLTGEGR